MATNPHPPGGSKHELWSKGADAAYSNYSEYFAGDGAGDDGWWEGYAATMRELVAGEDDIRLGRYLAGFDAGLEAAQEHGVASDGRDWKEIATHLLAQVIDLRLLAKWQANPDDAAENAVAYARAGFSSHINLARRRLADLPTPEDTP